MKKTTRIKSDYTNLKTRKKTHTYKGSIHQKENSIFADSKMKNSHLKSPYLENLSCNMNNQKRPISFKKKKFIIKLVKKKEKTKEKLNNRKTERHKNSFCQIRFQSKEVSQHKQSWFEEVSLHGG